MDTETTKTVIVSIVLIVYLIILFILTIEILSTNIEIYFLKFDFKNFLQMAEVIENTLYDICEKENIEVFNKTDAELNAGKKELLLGTYICLSEPKDEDDRRLIGIVNDFRKLFGQKNSILSSSDIEKITFPRILIVNKEEHPLKQRGYYITFFHELGHHFALKDINSTKESDADNYAWKLICESLPDYYRLIFENSLGKPNRLTKVERFRLYRKFLKVKKQKL